MTFVLIFLISLFTARAGLADDTLTIFGDAGKQTVVRIETADTREKQKTGLMFRKYLQQGAGMLFTFKRSGRIGMWMKNTYLPLDMFFIDENGTITDIAENTEPLSLKTIAPQSDVKAVLETNAGFAKKHGIKIGDTVGHAFFKTEKKD